MAKDKVIITPHGGHGTCFIARKLNCVVRPDTVIGRKRIDTSRWVIDCEWLFPLKYEPEWKKLTKTRIIEPTIAENLLRVIENTDKWVLLCGACSAKSLFLSKYRIPAYCILRDPVYAYTSFLTRQHPEHAEKLGGPDSFKCLRTWCESYLALIWDVQHAGGFFSHYEQFPADTLNDDLCAKLGGFKPSQNQSTPLQQESIDIINYYTRDQYNKIFGF